MNDKHDNLTPMPENNFWSRFWSNVAGIALLSVVAYAVLPISLCYVLYGANTLNADDWEILALGGFIQFLALYIPIVVIPEFKRKKKGFK